MTETPNDNPPERTCNCVDAPGCVHKSVREQRLAEAIFGTKPACLHPGFSVLTMIARVGQDDDAATMPVAFVAEITVSCDGCGERFLWQGVPAGLSYSAPAVSVDGTELRAPLRPESDPMFGRRRRLDGFSVTFDQPQTYGYPGPRVSSLAADLALQARVLVVLAEHQGAEGLSSAAVNRRLSPTASLSKVGAACEALVALRLVSKVRHRHRTADARLYSITTDGAARLAARVDPGPGTP